MRCTIRVMLTGCLLAAALAATAACAEWPMYKADAARSGVTAEGLRFPLAAKWIYAPGGPPAPAWPEPGKELHRMDYDYAFQPVIAGGCVYFGSSADDTVRACDAATGVLKWRFTTGGPIRFAPAVADGRAYVASDDGMLYCFAAKTGKVLWRFRAGRDEAQLLGNGRMISRWPLRSGVLVMDGRVYFTAGMWPTQGVYVYALDAVTGKKIWCNDSSGNIFINLPHCGSSGFSGVAPQGYLLATKDVLLVPTGRSVPAAFDRRTGRLLHYDPATSTKDGGAWATLADGVCYNPANPSWWYSTAFIGEAQPRSGDGMIGYAIASGRATVRLGNRYRALFAGGMMYAAVVNKDIEAVDVKAGKRRKWSFPHPGRVYCLAKAGPALLVGGKDGVTALDAATGKQIWHAATKGQVRGVAVAGGRLVAATSAGTLVCFEPGAASDLIPKLVTEARLPFALSERHQRMAADVVKSTGVSEGYALILGESDSGLAAALAGRTKLHVITCLPGTSPLATQRERLLAAGVCGRRVAAQWGGDSSPLPYASFFASLIVVSGDVEGLSGKEIYRVLRPCGGKLIFMGGTSARIRQILANSGIPAAEISADGRMVARGVLPGAGEWRHQWADGGHTGTSAESRVKLPLDMLWFGGPGPDRMMDRSSGSSPPLSVRGRVFVAGEHHVLAFDAYTGRQLWCREIRNAGRFSMKRASSNFAADDDSLYLAIGNECLQLDQVTGTTRATCRVPDDLVAAKAFAPGFVNAEENKLGTDDDKPVHSGWGWGYLGVTSDTLIGSWRMPVRYAKKLYGMIPWWVPRYSSALFALDKKDGAVLWHRQAARGISGADIAFGDGKVFFLDATPHPDLYGQAKRRGKKIEIKRSLVALSMKDGAELWRQEDIPVLPLDWSNVQYARGVVVVGANAAYDAKDGKKLWQRTVRPSRPPVIQGNWVIDMKCAYDLRTGAYRTMVDPLTDRNQVWRFMRSRGCGNIVGSETLLFFRGGNYGFYDSDNPRFTTFGGARPNCNVSIIAANGLLLMPEGSSGCECSYNFQTSLALVSGVDRGNSWYVLPSFRKNKYTDLIKRISVNLGAPGDRHDPKGRPWLGFPQLGIRSETRLAAPVTVVMDQPAWHHHPSTVESIQGTDMPWVYSSGVTGAGRLLVDVVLPKRGTRGVIVPVCDQAPTIDGNLDDACWQGAEMIPFAGQAHLSAPETRLFARRDAKALYFAYSRKAVVRDGKPLPLVGRQTAEDRFCYGDDRLEIMLTDKARGKAVHLGLSCGGGSFEGFVKRVSGELGCNLGWDGEWTRAVNKGDKAWTAEVAVPLETLRKAGLKPETLRFNVMSRNESGHGVPEIFLIDPDLEFAKGRYHLPIIQKHAPPPEARLFTVRLHFAEGEDIAKGGRLFDVLLQGKRVLKDFDILAEAGGRYRPVAREFTGVRATQTVVIETVGRPGSHRPLLNAVEVIETGRVPPPPPPPRPAKVRNAKRPAVDEQTVALLRFDETEGTVAADASGNHYDAKFEPMPRDPKWHKEGRFGGCLEFDGTNADENGDGKGDADSLIWLNGATPKPDWPGFTVEMWVRHVNLKGWQFYLLSSSGYGFVAKKDRIYSGFRPDGSKWVEVWSKPCLEANVWQHIALTYDRKAVRLYCDGVEVGKTEVVGGMPRGSSQVRLGHDNDMRPGSIRGMCGLIDEVRISNIARTNFP